MTLLGGEAGLSKRLLVEVRRFGEPVVDPGVHYPDPVSDQLHPVDPYLEVVVMAQRLDLLLRALNQEEAAELRALRLEDRCVETLDLAILGKALEVAPCLVEQVERLSFTPVRR